MAVLVYPRGRPSSQGSLRINRSNAIGQSLLGFVPCWSAVPHELATGRPLTGVTTAGSLIGQASPIAAGSGVYTARREFADWEVTTQPFSFIAYWVDTAYASASSLVGGNTSGVDHGYFVGELFGVGNRRYNAGGISVAPGIPWPQNVPLLTVLTYDGANLTAYLNGTLEGTTGGGAACSYDSFTRLTFGDNPDGGVWNGAGRVAYFALANRVLTQAEALSLYLQPWQMLQSQAKRFYLPGAVTTNVTVNATGVTGTGAVGSVTVTAGATVRPLGVFAGGGAYLKSVSAAGRVGTATALGTIVNVTVFVNGVQAGGHVSVTVNVSGVWAGPFGPVSTVLPDGVTCDSGLGSVVVNTDASALAGLVVIDYTPVVAGSGSGSVVNVTGVAAAASLGAVFPGTVTVAFPIGIQAFAFTGFLVAAGTQVTPPEQFPFQSRGSKKEEEEEKKKKRRPVPRAPDRVHPRRHVEEDLIQKVLEKHEAIERVREEADAIDVSVLSQITDAELALLVAHLID